MSDEIRQPDERPADETEERQKARAPEDEGPEVEGHRWGKHGPVERISEPVERQR